MIEYVVGSLSFRSEVVELLIAAGDIGSQAGLTAKDGPESGWRKAVLDTALRTQGSRFAKVMDEHLPGGNMSLREAAREIATTTSAYKKGEDEGRHT